MLSDPSLKTSSEMMFMYLLLMIPFLIALNQMMSFMSDHVDQ